MAKLLEVRGLTKKFGRLVAVNNLSFYVEEGEVHHGRYTRRIEGRGIHQENILWSLNARR